MTCVRVLLHCYVIVTDDVLQGVRQLLLLSKKRVGLIDLFLRSSETG